MIMSKPSCYNNANKIHVNSYSILSSILFHSISFNFKNRKIFLRMKISIKIYQENG